MTSNKFLNNSKFKVTIPSPSPTLYVTVARYWSPETSAQLVEHRDCQLTLSTSFHQGAVPIQTNRIAALVSLSKPSTSRPRFSPSSRSSFAAQVGGEWFSLSMRWLASKKPESSGRWHVSTVTYRPVLYQSSSRTENPSWLYGIIKKETKFASGWYQTEDRNFIGLGSPSGWLELTMGSFLETCHHVEGRERVERSGMTRSRGRSILWTRISICVFSTNGEIEDIYGQITLVVSSKLLTWILVTEERLFDVKSKHRSTKIDLYYWNCEFRSWWLERFLDLEYRCMKQVILVVLLKLWTWILVTKETLRLG